MFETKEKSPSLLPQVVGASSPLGCASGRCISKKDDTATSANCQGGDITTPALSPSETLELFDKFAPKHRQSLSLSESYDRLGFSSKSIRVRDCGTSLVFSHAILPDGSPSPDGHLVQANFCRERLCPMCAWRRSYKIFGQVSQIMEQIGSSYRFVFLTLTAPNCSGSELKSTLDRFFKSWGKLIRRSFFQRSVLGYFRALEVTRNKSTGTYHPHFHCVLAVPLGYLSPRFFVSRDKWLNAWRECYGDERIISVDVRFARGKTQDGVECSEALSSAVAEIAKYSVKSSDYLVPSDFRLTDDIVLTLTEALHGRRLAQFGGVFASTAQVLKLDDVEQGDLVHLDSEIDPSLAQMIVRYQWSTGVYKMVSSTLLTPFSEPPRE